MNRILSLFLAVALLLSTAGCGKPAENHKPDTDNIAAPEDIVTPAPEAPTIPDAKPVPEPEPEPEPEPVPTELTWVITNCWASGMSEPTWDSSELRGFSKGTVLNAAVCGDGWYAVSYDGQTMYLSQDEVNVIPTSNVSITYRSYGVSLSEAAGLQNDGSWIISRGGSWQSASADDILTYSDPSNFAEGTSGFFQFLVLTQPMGVSVDTLNAQLADKGILAGQGQAFSDAAYDFGINEAYLIAHALHETGNGSSTLANGVWYDPETETASTEETEGAVYVYNMYGIGAVDSDPLNGGAQYAYEHGWTTVYDAVYGGAQFIGRTYLNAGSATLSGQNTLYKMLWHPEWVETYYEKPWHEYATDVNWANAQTYFITQLLADYSDYSLVFEVPVYAG